MSLDTSARGALLRHGVIGGAVMVALILLMVFYSVVTGAVERGAQRRAEQLEPAAPAYQPSHRPIAVASSRPPATASFGTRTVSYRQPSN
jgi:hypothetical protein